MIMDILIAILFFALFDYFGYNISNRKKWVNEKFINPYRVIQAGVQIIITLFLWVHYGFISALSFNILWWFWIADWIYYLYCLPFGWVFGLTGSYKQPFDNNIRWAWWTPLGLFQLLMFGKEKIWMSKFDNKYRYEYRVIEGYMLLYQSIIGIGIVLILNIC